MVLGTSWTLGSTLTGVIVGVVSGPILVAFVGIDGYGVWASAIAVASIFSLGGDLGVASALPKMLAERRGRNEAYGTLGSSSVLFALLAGGVTAVGLGLSSTIIGRYITFRDFALLLQIQSLQLPFNFAEGALLAVLQGARNFKAYSISVIALAVTNLVLMTSFLALGAGLPGAMIASLISTILLFVAMTILYRKNLRFSGLKALRTDLAGLVPFGLQLTVSILLSRIAYQIDIVFLSLLVPDPKVVGAYALAVFVVRILWILPGSISLTTYPVVSEYHAQANGRRVTNYIATALTASLAVTGVLATGMVLFGRPALRLAFGTDALPAYGLCLILLAGTASLGSLRAVAPAIPAVGRPDIAVWISATGTMLTVTLCAFLTAATGVIGTAVAVSIAFALQGVALIWALNKYVLRSREEPLLFRRVVPVALGAVAVGIVAYPLAAPDTLSVESAVPAAYWIGASILLLLLSGGRRALKRIFD